MLQVISIAGLLMMTGGLLGLWKTQSLLSSAPLTVVLQVVAIGLMIWARITFGRRSFHAAANPTTGGLVTTGPYHYIRHPIYTAVCLFAFGGFISNYSALSATMFAVVFAGSLIRMLCEERLVSQRYPEYRKYAMLTKRMLPGLFLL